MNYRTAIVVFSILIAGGLIFNYFVNEGYFPVAFVGIRPISAKTLEDISVAAMRYYENAFRTYGSDLNELNKPESKREVRRAVLDKLIEEIIIRHELQKRLGKDLDLVVNGKLEEVERNIGFQSAAATLYGLEPEGFRRMFLVPQAEHEILEGRLILERREIKDWLAEARRTAKVIILSSEFKWGGEGVELRN